MVVPKKNKVNVFSLICFVYSANGSKVPQKALNSGDYRYSFLTSESPDYVCQNTNEK